MDHRSWVLTSPLPSMGSPSTLNMRPSTFSPTGTEIGPPMEVTSMPRPMPSLGESIKHRTVSRPMCWATSMTRFCPSASSHRASRMEGSSP